MNRNEPEVSVIVPTYNEAENINTLLDRVHDVLKGYDHEILVVDDDSPDRTWELVLKRKQKEEWLGLIRRENDRGLSKAVIEGFQHSRGQCLAVIDADLQHDEQILPILIEQVKSVPIAIGSRYIQGGGVRNWSLVRRITSFFATQIASLFLNITVADPMSGFFAIEREVYEKVKNKINPQGYKILLEILYYARSNTIEIPYHFRNRLAGESKLTSRVAVEYIAQVFRLRRNDPLPKSFFKYCTVGFSGVIIDMASFAILLNISDLAVELCGALSAQTAIVTNFILNDHWTFLTRGKNVHWWNRFLKFELCCLVGLSIKTLTISAAFRLLKLPPMLGNAIGIALGVFSNFTLSKLWAWKN